MADPRWVDPSVDPNDRGPGSYLGDPRLINDGPSALGRFTTARSWLSQWSLDDAQVDGVEGAKRVSVPVLILENSADDACPPGHPRAIFAAVPHDDKEFTVVEGANHYYSGQREHLERALGHVARWIHEHKLAD
jgi:alpha-beta hydrolase superfamily lysophospholipase